MPKSQRKEAEFSPELLDNLISGHESPEDFFGTDGLLKRLQAALIERALGAELTCQGLPRGQPCAPCSATIEGLGKSA